MDMDMANNLPINHIIRTADMDAGNINQTKQWRRVNMMLSLKGDYDGGVVNLSATQYNDRSTTTQSWTQSPLATATSFDPVIDSHAELRDLSRQMSLEISSNTIGRAFRLHGLDVFYRPGSIENRA